MNNTQPELGFMIDDLEHLPEMQALLDWRAKEFTHIGSYLTHSEITQDQYDAMKVRLRGDFEKRVFGLWRMLRQERG